MKISFTVSFELPEGASREAAKDYVYGAICAMRGCLHPPGAMGEDDIGDPFFSLDTDTVKVVP